MIKNSARPGFTGGAARTPRQRRRGPRVSEPEPGFPQPPLAVRGRAAPPCPLGGQLDHELAGDGRISGATRADFAAAAAVVLTSDGHDGAVYELGGPPFTMTEFAAEVAAQSGKPVTYQSLPADAYTQMLLSAGLPAPFAALLVDSDLGVSRGELFTTSTDLQRLIGRPSTPLTDVVAAAVKTA